MIRLKMAWLTIYDLKNDHRFVESVQHATLNTKIYGIEQTHGLFGSPDWWGQVESGALPLETLKGKIIRVSMESMRDWPVFEMLCDDGTSRKFTREQSPGDGTLDHHYQVGKSVEVDFVWQQFRKERPEPRLSDSTDCVVAIRIEIN